MSRMQKISPVKTRRRSKGDIKPIRDRDWVKAGNRKRLQEGNLQRTTFSENLVGKSDTR